MGITAFHPGDNKTSRWGVSVPRLCSEIFVAAVKSMWLFCSEICVAP